MAMIQRSEEQKKDLKMKVYTAIFFLIVGGFVAYYGPGLHRFQVKPAMLAKDPDAMLRAASILWWTGRREAAKEVYEDFYLMYRGNELADEEMLEWTEELYGENEAWNSYAPNVWIRRGYWDSEEEVVREPEIKRVNPDGPPHPRLAEALLRMGEYWEDEKERIYYVHLYRTVTVSFPNADPETMKRAENGLLRAQSRSL